MAYNRAQGIATIPDPDEASLGPAMLALNLAQRRFVMAMVTVGGSQSRCATAAGYAGDRATASVAGARLAHDEKVQAALQEVGMQMLGSGRIPAVKFILETIENPQVEMKDRLKAAEMVMNRTGLHATTEQKVTVTRRDDSGAEMIKQITQMAKTLGVDPHKLIGNYTDAEYEEVKPVDEDSIEDIL